MLEDAPDRFRRRRDLFQPMDLDDDLVQGHALHLDTAGALTDQGLAVTMACRLQGNVDSWRAGSLRFAGLGELWVVLPHGADGMRCHDADDPVVMAANADFPAQWRFQGEQLPYQFGPQNADAGNRFEVQIGEKSAQRNLVISHLRIPGNGAHDFAIHSPGAVPGIFADDAGRYHEGNAGNGGTNAAQVGIGQAVLQDETPGGAF